VFVWVPWEGRIAKVNTRDVTKHPLVRSWIKQAAAYKQEALSTDGSKSQEVAPADVHGTALPPPPPPAAAAGITPLTTESCTEGDDMEEDDQLVHGACMVQQQECQLQQMLNGMEVGPHKQDLQPQQSKVSLAGKGLTVQR
jgi:hypothetical protein